MTIQSARAAKPFVAVVGTDFEIMSMDAIHEALAMAGREPEAEVHVVHVVAPLTMANVAPLGLIDFTHEAQVSLHGALVREGVERRVTSHVLVGDPASLLVQTAERLRADVLVVGTHGRKGLAHLAFGSVAEALVRRAPCSVLVVRKDHAPVVEIEPPCAECSTAATATGKTDARCARHAGRRHPSAHVYDDGRSDDLGMGAGPLGRNE